MKVLKEKKSIIISFIIGVILASGITVYATNTYLASQVTYRDGKNVEQALNELFNKKNNINFENKLELIGTNVGKDINIPVGYKYVVISNSEWTIGGINHLPNIKIINNTNSNIIIEKSSSDYSGNYGGCSWLTVAEILDTSKTSVFSSNSSPAYNIIFGVKE